MKNGERFFPKARYNDKLMYPAHCLDYSSKALDKSLVLLFVCVSCSVSKMVFNDLFRNDNNVDYVLERYFS